MRKFWATAFAALMLWACGGGKKSDPAAGGSSNIDNGFTAQFQPLTLKFDISDTALDRLSGTEKPITAPTAAWFPDSLINGYFGKGARVKYYALGKVQNEGNELYAVMKAVSPEKKAAVLLCFDNQGVYKAGLLLCRSDNDPHTYFSGSIDKSFNIKVVEETRTSPEDVSISEKIMAYNSGRFMVVVNNDPGQELAIINPIDTLPQVKKYSGDYWFDDKNFVSIRDGKDSTEFMFFYHFRKGSDDCEGEIKGKGTVTAANTARFMQDGDPCVINFKFTPTQIIVKEDHGCGNYRSMDCKLDGTYTKKKKTVSAEPEKKPKETKPGAKPGTPPAKPKPPAKKAPVVNTEVQ